MRFLTILALMTTLGLTAACADDDPVANGTASASASITDDPSSTSAFRGSDDAAFTTLADGHFSGHLSSDAQVAISANGSTWVDLGSPSSVMVNLQSTGDETTVHANAAIPVGTYTRVRLTLSGAQANLDAGATLGGITFGSAIAMRVGGADGNVVIEKEVEPFTVNTNSHVRILVDLNSELWVNQQNAEDEEVEDEEVQDSAEAGREVDDEEMT